VTTNLKLHLNEEVNQQLLVGFVFHPSMHPPPFNIPTMYSTYSLFKVCGRLFISTTTGKVGTLTLPEWWLLLSNICDDSSPQHSTFEDTRAESGLGDE
jgi:hypothetical protein